MNIRKDIKIILKEDLSMTPFKKGTKMEVIGVEGNSVKVKCGWHMGVFNVDEINKYFDEYNPGSEYEDIKRCIVNKNVVIVILNSGAKGVAKCLPEDEFNEDTGIRIAYIKAKIKELTKELKSY